MKEIILHIRRISALVLNILFNHKIIYYILGLLNRPFKFVKTVFVAYPANRKYAEAYTYGFTRKRIAWKPFLVGIYRQNKKWGIMFVISSTEEDFNNADNIENLKNLTSRVNKICKLLNADFEAYAGILPSVFKRNSIEIKKESRELTIKAIIGSINKVLKRINYPNNIPVIILGAGGYLGTKLKENLFIANREIITIDIGKQGKDSANLEDWPRYLENKKAILINVANKDTLKHYANLFWPELILLNEAYGNFKDCLEILDNKGSLAFHVVGVKALSIPKLPKIYSGAVPLCAAWDAQDRLEFIVRPFNKVAKDLVGFKNF